MRRFERSVTPLLGSGKNVPALPLFKAVRPRPTDRLKPPGAATAHVRGNWLCAYERPSRGPNVERSVRQSLTALDSGKPQDEQSFTCVSGGLAAIPFPYAFATAAILPAFALTKARLMSGSELKLVALVQDSFALAKSPLP